MAVRRRPPDVDLVWVREHTDDLEELAARLARMAAEARAARRRGVDRSCRYAIASTASLVAEWLSYRDEEDLPQALLVELWRRATSHEPDSGPGLALLWRALDHDFRRFTHPAGR